MKESLDPNSPGPWVCTELGPFGSRGFVPTGTHTPLLSPTLLTYGPVPFRVHLLSHAQCLRGGNVHITGDHHQVDGLLSLDVFLDESLDL